MEKSPMDKNDENQSFLVGIAINELEEAAKRVGALYLLGKDRIDPALLPQIEQLTQDPNSVVREAASKTYQKLSKFINLN